MANKVREVDANFLEAHASWLEALTDVINDRFDIDVDLAGAVELELEDKITELRLADEDYVDAQIDELREEFSAEFKEFVDKQLTKAVLDVVRKYFTVKITPLE